MTVVLVDPKLETRSRLASLLRRAGHSVVGEASSARDGVLLAVEREPALVVADLLAFDDGLAWLRVLRQCLPRTRVVVRSEVGADDEAVACLRSGATQVVRKGASGQEVMDAL